MTIEYRVRPVTRYIITRYESSERVGSVGTVGEFPNVSTANRICEALAATESGATAFTAPSHDSDCAVHNMPAYPEGQCDCSARSENDLVD